MPDRRTTLAYGLLIASPLNALAQRNMSIRRRDRDSLYAILGQSPDHNYVDDVPSPLGSVKLRLPRGEELERKIAAWTLVGDLHFMFVFGTGRGGLSFSSPKELSELGIRSLGEALDLALANAIRDAGVPRRTEWKAGISQVASGQPELNSSFFLDRVYWSTLQAEYASPLVVAVPTFKTLLFAPLRQADAVTALREEARAMYTEVGKERASAGLFVFQEGTWSVLAAGR